MNADGSGVTDLTNYPGDHGYPVWSPDGNSLIYLSHGNAGIGLKKSDGSQIDLLADDQQPAWSPDGQHIAFITDRNTRATPFNLSEEIYLINADGTNQTRLGFGDAPTWSPDGKHIAFVSNGGELSVMASDGSGATGLGTGDVFPTRPAWSPDGSKIAFTYSGHTNDRSSIYVTDVNGSHQVRLTSGGWADSPAWSPDGKQIAFWSNRDGNNQIYVMPAPGPQAQVNADGSGVARLTKDTAINIDPTWSPDGSMIAYHSATSCLEQICIMTSAGRLVTCTRGAGRYSEAATHTAWRLNHSP